MPIKPENRKRYPKNWKEIRAKILERANHRCEWAGCKAINGYNNPITGSKVVLTIAHLDHIPEHCDESNLRAWCQLHHLRYDAEHHAETAYATRRNGRAIDMFS